MLALLWEEYVNVISTLMLALPIKNFSSTAIVSTALTIYVAEDNGSNDKGQYKQET